jgi:hypothetical protein
MAGLISPGCRTRCCQTHHRAATLEHRNICMTMQLVKHFFNYWKFQNEGT